MTHRSICDDGRGLDLIEQGKRRAGGAVGLRIPRGPVAGVDGTFEVDSAPGTGRAASIGLPLR